MSQEDFTNLIKTNSRFAMDAMVVFEVRHNLFNAADYAFEEDFDATAIAENAASSALWAMSKICGLPIAAITLLVDNLWFGEFSTAEETAAYYGKFA